MMVERYNVDVEKNENGYWEGVLLVSANGAWVSYSDYATLERQIAELRAELINRVNYWSELYSKEYHRAQAAEAENARLRALPLKDEVERELADIEENLDDAVQYLVDLAGAKPSPLSPHNCRIYIDHARMGARNLASLLSRLRAEEQEGWRSMDKAPKDASSILYVNKFGEIGYCYWSEAGGPFDQSMWRDELVNDECYPVGWLPADRLPAAPSNRGGDRG